MGSLDMSTVMRKLFGLLGVAAGLAVVSWLLKDRLVPVPDTAPADPRPFRRRRSRRLGTPRPSGRLDHSGPLPQLKQARTA